MHSPKLWSQSDLEGFGLASVMGPVSSLAALLKLSSLLQEALQLPAGCLLRLLCLCLLLCMLFKIFNRSRVARLHLRRLIPARISRASWKASTSCICIASLLAIGKGSSKPLAQLHLPCLIPACKQQQQPVSKSLALLQLHCLFPKKQRSLKEELGTGAFAVPLPCKCQSVMQILACAGALPEAGWCLLANV